MRIQIEQEGRRLYLRGDTYSVRDQIRRAGATWDHDAKAWYVGTQRRELAEQIVARCGTPADDAPETVDTAAHVIRGRAKYRGHTYYVLAEGISARTERPYAKLCYRDGSRVFWASASAIEAGELEILRRYDDDVSIRQIRSWAERIQTSREEHGGDGMCAECEERRAVTEAADSSGIVAGVCARCASYSCDARSYA